MSHFILCVFALIVSGALWVSTSVDNALRSLYKAGLLNKWAGVRVGGGAAMLATMGCAMSNASVGGFECLAIVTLSSSFACAMYVIVMAAYYGVDQAHAMELAYLYKETRALPKAQDWDSEELLQAYLNATYGRGRVSAAQIIAERRNQPRAI